MGDPLIR